ncbi:hypothetical protein PSPHG_CDS_0146 [Pseudomonas phage Psxphi15]
MRGATIGNRKRKTASAHYIPAIYTKVDMQRW